MKVAIVHDWLTNYGGAETFVELWLRMYPEADIYTLVYDKKKMRGHFEGARIFTSRLQKIPFATKIYTKLLKFMPAAFESFDLSGYDLVLSSSSSCAKGVIVPPSVPHIAYIHSPMRYAWDLFFDYRKRSGLFTRLFMDRWIPAIRLWDYVSSQRIDTLVANSKYIKRRIEKFWNRDARVIYSPVNVSRFNPDPAIEKREDFYVFFSRLVPYKRADMAIEACISLGKKLFVIGSGSEEKKLKKLAGGNAGIVFTGRIPDAEVQEKLQRCRAMLFCAEEDFGLAPLEAGACGAPVIAFGKGGALETVVDGITGIFFERQDAQSLAQAIERFECMDEKGTFRTEKIVGHARSFTEERFRAEFQNAVRETFEKVSKNTPVRHAADFNSIDYKDKLN